MPAAEVTVPETTVRRLLAAQWPGWDGQPTRLLANGWDNVLYRVGDEHVVRLPRRGVAAELLAHETRWLSTLSESLPLPIPAPMFVGRPGAGYPWAWSVVPWIEGMSAAEATTIDHETCARQLADFLRALHLPAPEDAPHNPFRGVPLADRDGAVRERAASVADLVDMGKAVEIWEEALSAAEYAGPPLWLHGDLHPHNLLVVDGMLSGVIDFGDLTAGDPATDLAVMWSFLPIHLHDVFREGYGEVDADLDKRIRGWALALGLAYLAFSADNPVMDRLGRHALGALDVID